MHTDLIRCLLVRHSAGIPSACPGAHLGAGTPAAERGLQRRRKQPGRRGLLLHRRLAQRYQLRRPLIQLVLQPPAGTAARHCVG